MRHHIFIAFLLLILFLQGPVPAFSQDPTSCLDNYESNDAETECSNFFDINTGVEWTGTQSLKEPFTRLELRYRGRLYEIYENPGEDSYVPLRFHLLSNIALTSKNIEKNEGGSTQEDPSQAFEAGFGLQIDVYDFYEGKKLPFYFAYWFQHHSQCNR